MKTEEYMRFKALVDHKSNLSEIVDTILSRRDIFKLSASGACALSVMGCTSIDQAYADNTQQAAFDFKEIPSGVDGQIHVPEGYDADIVISWGDAFKAATGEFDAYNQTLEGQLKRFGYNNDFIGYVPLPEGTDNSYHGLLCVNHEYAYEPMMFEKPWGQDGAYSKEQTQIAQASCGCSIIEIKRDKTTKKWSFIQDSPYNRRISMYDTKISITGPAAGHQRLVTSADPSGKEIIGTFQNCAGGITPWGTYLTCEENIDYGFGNFENADQENPEIQKSQRFSVSNRNKSDWFRHNQRFDLAQEPNEFNRFGWIVEIDPYDPQSMPRKHSALGRFKHENCMVVIDPDTQKAVAYMGDDQYFEYLYKFVSKDKFIKDNKTHNMRLLQEGTLYVAKFTDDMQVEWLPLIFGKGGLGPENGFNSQADVVIDARIAADLMGATTLDRPEGIAHDPINGDIYVSLTMNENRDTPNIVNPRIHNEHGQILCLKTNGQHNLGQHQWDILLLGGPESAQGTGHKAGTTKDGTLSCPDNLTFDHSGRLWVASDQGGRWGEKTGNSDGIFAVEHNGAHRGRSKLFFRSPVGAETTGICFAPDDETIFVCVQHPGTDGTKAYEGFNRRATFLDPATRWPNPENSNIPPLPSIVQITKKGQKI